MNNKHNYYCKIGVHEEIYNRSFGEYLKENKKEKIKILSIDNTFIENKNGIDDAGGNIYYKIKEEDK